MELSNRIWHLIARTLSGEASAEEQVELEAFWRNNPEMLQQYEVLRRVWDHHGDQSIIGEDHAGLIVSKILHEVDEQDEQADELIAAYDYSIRRRRNRVRRNWIMAVGTAAFLAGAVWFFAQRGSSKQNEPDPKILATQKGSRSRTLLPDGSTVWLNAGSKLEYVNDFSGVSREIRLEGEAFFDVVKESRPFIVHTSGIDIKVLGTSFNVKSYPEDKTVETTLYRGSVKVFRSEAKEETAIHLKPNEKLILPKQAANKPSVLSEEKPLAVVKETLTDYTLAHIDSTKKENERFETAWIYSRLEFRGDDFEVLARKLERWYNVTIVFTDEKVKRLAFNGSFEMETVEQAFRYLKEVNSFNYKINSREILVGSR